MYEGFKKLEGKLAGKPGITNPGALAASIGRKKYGAKAFASHAAKGQTFAPKRAHRQMAAKKMMGK